MAVCAKRRTIFKPEDAYRPIMKFPKEHFHEIYVTPSHLELKRALRITLELCMALPKEKPLEKQVKTVDDTKSRLSIWKALCGDDPMPIVEENAVEKYAGMLDNYLPQDFQVDNIIERVKKS